MKKLNKIILVLAIVAVAGLIFIQSQVHATNPGVVINVPATQSAGNTAAQTNTANTTNTAVNTANTINTVNTVNTVNKVNNNTNTLPKAGIEDSPVGIIMIIGVISAIYAYKKIRDYNV